VVLVRPALRVDANVRHAGVLRREVVREHGELADGLERWLAVGRLAEDRAVRALAVDREGRAVAERPDKLEARVAGRGRDVRVEVEELVDVAAIARKLDDLARRDAAADLRGLFLDHAALRDDVDGLVRRADLELGVGAYGRGAVEHDADRERLEPLGRHGYRIGAVLEARRL